MSSEDLPVAIIGAGMAGPVLALLLHQRSIASIVFELRPEGTQQGGNIALAPNALRVLNHIGVYDRLRLQGYNYEELAFMNGAGLVLGRLWNGSQKVYNFPALRIHRSTVKEELIRECKKNGIDIRWGKKCSGIEETESGVVVKFADGEELHARFVVGADGIHSHVRSCISSGKNPIYSGFTGIMGTVMADDLQCLQHGHDLDLPGMIFGAKGSFAIMPASFDGKEVGYFATLEVQDRTRDEWDAFGENTTGLKDLLSERFLPEENGFPPLVRELVTKTPHDSLTSWPKDCCSFFSAPHLDSWSSQNNHVFVIGDATHAIPPTGGQGAAMAFEDAETLAYVLSRVLAPDFDAQALSDIVSRWERHRQGRIAKVIDFTTKNGDLRKSSPHFYEQAAKEWVIWATF